MDPTQPHKEGSSYMPASSNGPQHHGPDSPRIKFLAMATLLIVSLSTGFLGGWLSFKYRGIDSATNASKQQVVLKTQGQVISSIAKTVGESVVSVTATQTAPASFFSMGGTQEGAGTGIIISTDGLIMTNRHVVPAGTTDVSVTLADGTELSDVTVVGRTNSSDSLDIAFLKVNDTKGKKLKAAAIGDSSKMAVGDPVVAIGNALGQFQNTVTSGILSGYGRSLTASDGSGASSESLENLFQTDAAINEGNSGGPLVNLDGEVIGINTAVAGNAQNIGFSIPINDVSGLITSVKQSGKLERPFLGVVYIPITNDVAEQYSLDKSSGAYIPQTSSVGTTPVLADGPAAKAGIQAGDIILKINDETIDQKHSLASLINKHKVGDKVTLTIHREGKDSKLDVTLGTAPTN
ncbi:MAG TPA: trypsin-like peptidase domain-containing protein [Candidatus Saccharimonadales bacterium]|nr:trypsin-like peptidase domain-containing protein [Candidatus Saccharimonadales bacterium]